MCETCKDKGFTLEHKILPDDGLFDGIRDYEWHEEQCSCEYGESWLARAGRILSDTKVRTKEYVDNHLFLMRYSTPDEGSEKLEKIYMGGKRYTENI